MIKQDNSVSQKRFFFLFFFSFFSFLRYVGTSWSNFKQRINVIKTDNLRLLFITVMFMEFSESVSFKSKLNTA